MSHQPLSAQTGAASCVATLRRPRLDDWRDSDQDLEATTQVWRKFSSKAKAVFSLLMDNPGDAMTGEELAERLNIQNGKYGVAGVLAWPMRHCAEVGRVVLCRYEESAGPGGQGACWIDHDVAKLFNRVRAESGR